jgi:hypothetical protein
VALLDVVILVVAVLLLAVAGGGLTLLRLPPAELGHTFDGIDAVEIMVAAGRVEVSERDRGDLRVALTVRRRPGRAMPTLTTSGSVLRIDGRSSDVRARLTVPPRTRVRAEVRSGEITLWGAGGEFSLVTRDGTIAGRELGPGAVTARSQNGDVNLHFSEPPDGVRAISGAGMVTVVLPHGAYAVDVETADPGAATVEVPGTAGAARRVLARSVSGSVRVNLAEPAGPLLI